MQTAVLRSANGTDELSDRQLKEAVPAIFAAAPRKDVSEKYAFVSTLDLVNTMRSEGFVPVEARQHRLRAHAWKVPYTKHMLRFRVAGKKPQLVGDCVPEIVLLNSHDRSSKAELYGGLFRLVCSNGLIVSDSAHIAPVVVRHTERPVQEFMSGVEKVVKGYKRIIEHMKAMQAIKLTDRQQLKFATDALELRSGSGLILPESLLRARRSADEGPDLWRTMNRVQENLLAGGVTSMSANGRPTTTKPMVSLYQNMQVNMGVWELAMATINKAAAR
jgi:hypothetical protein